MAYMSVNAIDFTIAWLHAAFPTITEIMIMPEKSAEGRTIRALKIASGGGTRPGIAILGGVHARELVNPDLVLSFALDLCGAYSNGTGLTYGGQSYPASIVSVIVEGMDTWILPLVNPDGRDFVLKQGGDLNWRKNRRPTGTCTGVDINRNFDFLWSSGIGTSTDPCDFQIYRGPQAFSESETRNVRALLDTHANIRCLVDVHSYSNDILWSWGDDDDQTTDPTKNFQNPVYDGLRGGQNPGVYGEFIKASDRDWYVATGKSAADAIAAVRGTVYAVKQSVGLYPTTATSDDYSYSRTFVDGSKTKVRAFTVETGVKFQPAYSEALQIMKEVSAGLIKFCTATLCAVDAMAGKKKAKLDLVALREFRDVHLAGSTAGSRFVALLEAHGGEAVAIVFDDPDMHGEAAQVLQELGSAVTSNAAVPLDAALVERTRAVLDSLHERAGPQLRAAVREIQAALVHFSGKPPHEGLRDAGRAAAEPTSPATGQ